MTEIVEPTWRLVLESACRLTRRDGEFRLYELVNDVQKADPSRGRGSIQPVVQGMTVNAGKGPASPCGTPLERIGHGRYRLVPDAPNTSRTDDTEQLAPPSGRRTAAKNRAGHDDVVRQRLRSLTAQFGLSLDAYDRQVPFLRTGQYEFHRATVERRRRSPDVRAALADDKLTYTLYETLRRWGIGRRASRLVPLPEFRERLQENADGIAALDGLTIDDPGLDVEVTSERVWAVVESLGVTTNNALIVPGTKTLHHLLPDLVPPMDRAWTGAFFAWSGAAPQYAQRATFTRTFARFAETARMTEPTQYVGPGWRTSRSKVLDNAVIGYCKLHGISPAGTPKRE